MDKIIIQGLPYDEKSSYLKGARLAPPLIRQLLNNRSTNSFAENGVDINCDGVIDNGDFTISEYFDIEKITLKHLNQEDRIISLGGDHSITFPIIQAYNKIFPSFDILQIDAHPDLYDEYEFDIYSHACPFARIMENKLVSKLLQVGIRTLNKHQSKQAKKFKVQMIETKEFDSKRIPDFKNPVYISLDMDAFDPAFAPGVSHCEPGGLNPRQVIDIIHNIKSEIIGADIVEYNPERDVQNITGSLAAKMMKEIIGKMISGKDL